MRRRDPAAERGRWLQAFPRRRYRLTSNGLVILALIYATFSVWAALMTHRASVEIEPLPAPPAWEFGEGRR